MNGRYEWSAIVAPASQSRQYFSVPASCAIASSSEVGWSPPHDSASHAVSPCSSVVRP